MLDEASTETYDANMWQQMAVAAAASEAINSFDNGVTRWTYQ